MKDILLDNNMDIIFENGDIATGDTDAQNIHLILTSEKGEYKEYPLLGVGLTKYVKGNRVQEMKREIQVQLGWDGYENAKIDIDETGKISIEL